MAGLRPNEGKSLTIAVNGTAYARLPVKTHVITVEDDLLDVVTKYVKPHLAEDDLVFVSERVVAITQGRAFPIKDIHPSPMARFLSKFVTKSPYGIGVGSPWTMELAIGEAGILRILVGTVAAACTRPFGIRGVFYKICGQKVAAIDGPCSYTLPPYNEYAVLGPTEPDEVACSLRDVLGREVVLIDANDLGVSVLGKSTDGIPDEFCEALFRDNPLGQSSEQTPLCIVRKGTREPAPGC